MFLSYSLFIQPAFCLYQWPGIKGVGNQAVETFTHPLFLAPLTTAIVLQIGHLDEKLSDKILAKSPLFGKQTSAGRYSDRMKTVTTVTMLASSLFIPCVEKCFFKKLLVSATDYALQASAIQSRNIIRATVKRKRPDPSTGNRSLPSGHATAAAARVTLGNENIKAYNISKTLKTTLQIVQWVMAYSIAYARVEGGAHYPADTLVGISLAFGVSHFFKNVFYPSKNLLRSEFFYSNKTAYLGFKMTF